VDVKAGETEGRGKGEVPSSSRFTSYLMLSKRLRRLSFLRLRRPKALLFRDGGKRRGEVRLGRATESGRAVRELFGEAAMGEGVSTKIRKGEEGKTNRE
jgi:hypothetical protein